MRLCACVFECFVELLLSLFYYFIIASVFCMFYFAPFLLRCTLSCYVSVYPFNVLSFVLR